MSMQLDAALNSFRNRLGGAEHGPGVMEQVLASLKRHGFKASFAETPLERATPPAFSHRPSPKLGMTG